MNTTLLIVYIALVSGICFLGWKARKEGARADENGTRLMYAQIERDRLRERGAKIVAAWEQLGFDQHEQQTNLDAHIRILQIELQHHAIIPFPPAEPRNEHIS